MNVRLYLSHDIQNTYILHFWFEKVAIFPYFTQRYNGRHYVSLKSVNRWWFIDFIAWRISLPDATSYDKHK